MEPRTGIEPALTRFAVCRVAIPPPRHFWGAGTDSNCHLLGSQPRALPLCYLRHCLAEEVRFELTRPDKRTDCFQDSYRYPDSFGLLFLCLASALFFTGHRRTSREHLTMKILCTRATCAFSIIAGRPPLLRVYWCVETESNCRHKDFQSFALPTELSTLIMAPCNGIEPLASERQSDMLAVTPTGLNLVPREGLEPPRLSARVSKTRMATNFITWANIRVC